MKHEQKIEYLERMERTEQKLSKLEYSRMYMQQAEDESKPKGKKPRKPDWNEQRDKKRNVD